MTTMTLSGGSMDKLRSLGGTTALLMVLAVSSVLTMSCAGARHGLPAVRPEATRQILGGADLSSVNELEDCGAVYQVDGEARDPFEILAAAGMNAVRVRVWVEPTRTNYSTLEDAARTLRRAKALGLSTMLDFHYSDDWADPGKQVIPAAWAPALHDVATLAERVRSYTVESLSYLGAQGLMPDVVQVGNEINTEILRPAGTRGWPIDWLRNATLLNAGIGGVRAMAGRYGSAPRVLLHIAQPENVEPWFDAALAHGVDDFDYIGISYYPYWSVQSIPELGETVAHVRKKYDVDVMVVETGYDWTHEADLGAQLGAVGASPSDPKEVSSGGVASHSRLPEMEPGYPPSTDGQRRFLPRCHEGGAGRGRCRSLLLGAGRSPNALHAENGSTEVDAFVLRHRQWERAPSERRVLPCDRGAKQTAV
ncbi:MAG: glycosyl hydrolase 53 family protein [Candidatus Eisenbacteria bacterium]